MGFEQIYRKKVEKKVGEQKKESKVSVSEMLKEENLAYALKIILEERNERELAAKILNPKSEELSQEEVAKLWGCRGEALEAVNKTDEILGLLRNGKLVIEMAAYSQDIKELGEVVGLENLGDLLDRKYFIELVVKDKETFDSFYQRVKLFSELPKRYKVLDKTVDGIADKFRIPPEDLKSAFEIEDSEKRELKLKEIVEKHIGKRRFYEFYTKGMFVPETDEAGFNRREVALGEIKQGALDLDNLIQETEATMNDLGGEVSNLIYFLNDDSLKKKAQRRITDIALNRNILSEHEPELSYSEAAAALNNKEEILENWSVFLRDEAIAANPNQEKINVNGWWNSLNDDDKNERIKKFKIDRVMKKKKGFWSLVFRDLINIGDIIGSK